MRVPLTPRTGAMFAGLVAVAGIAAAALESGRAAVPSTAAMLPSAAVEAEAPPADVPLAPVPVGAPAAAGLVPHEGCAGGFLVDGTDLCTHGDDGHHPVAHAPAPPPEPAPGGSTASACAPAAGPAVQVVYAHGGSAPDRSAELAPRIRAWAGSVERIFRDSSGGTRGVRWVTASDCSIDVAAVRLSDAATRDFGATIRELAAQGLDDGDRRYLIWFDAEVYCGIATVQLDDRPLAANRNNGGMAAYARVDRACWGGYAEAHELVHMLGGVQRSAPNATRFGHCRDESDLMCYPDEAGAAMRQVCPSAHEWHLDCGGDDYFALAPAAGTYLASHWNVANSSFLLGAPAATIERRFSGTMSSGARSHRERIDAGAGAARVVVEHATGPSEDVLAVGAGAAVDIATGDGLALSQPATWTVRVIDGAGRVVAEERGADGTLEAAFTAPATGPYTVEVVSDGSGSWTAVASVRRP